MTIFTGKVGDPEIAAAIDAGRVGQLEVVMEALRGWQGLAVDGERRAGLEAAIQGWLFFVEGAVLRWLEHRELKRSQMRALLAAGFAGAIFAAKASGAEDQV